MKKSIILSLILLAVVGVKAQSGTWSGKLNVQGVSLPLVFHLQADSSTIDSPSQGVRGLPVVVGAHRRVCL